MGEEAYSVTQNDAGFDLGVASSDGIESGTLEDIQIDETGTVLGLFSNGEVVDLARVALASFRNNAGLERLRDNLYSESTDSGRPLWRGQASEGIAARIRSGALERSNVDLSQEFAMMITTQRGFQANAKIVTVGDEMLLEAVSLKR
jgi:flagellar hook protein FlgE